MSTALSLISFLGFVAAIILSIIAIVAKLRRRPSKRFTFAALSAFGIFIVTLIGAIALLPPEATSIKQSAQLPEATSHPLKTLPPYLALRVGLHAYANSNAEGDDSKGTLFLDWPTVVKWNSGEGGGPEALRHVDIPVGTEVAIESWRTIGSGESKHVMIKVTTLAKPGASGYIMDIMLIPKISPGTRLIVTAPGTGLPDKMPMYDNAAGKGDHPTMVPVGSDLALLDVVHDKRIADTFTAPFHARVVHGLTCGLKKAPEMVGEF